MSEVDLDIRKFLSDHKAFFDQCVTVIGRHREPLFAVYQRMRKTIFLFAGIYIKPVLAAVENEHHLFPNRDIKARSVEIVTTLWPIELRRHLPNKIERCPDPP